MDEWIKKYIAYVYNRTLSAIKKKSMSFFKKRYAKIGELLVRKGAVRRWEEHIG